MADEKDETGEKAEKGGEEKTPAAAGAKRSKLPLILAIVGVVVLLGGGGAAYFLGVFGGRGDEAQAAKEGGEHEGKAGKHEGAGQAGALVPLDTFVANLADEDARRYLKATIQVEFFAHDVPAAFKDRLPQIRDLLLTLLSSKSFAEVRTTEGKQQLREEVIARLNRVLDDDAVKAVYFTEFIVQ
jgi:flagellar FliL protein